MSQTKFFVIISILVVILICIMVSTFITNATWIIGAVIVVALWLPISYYMQVRIKHKGAKICVYLLFLFIFNWIVIVEGGGLYPFPLLMIIAYQLLWAITSIFLIGFFFLLRYLVPKYEPHHPVPLEDKE